ncbi:GATA transcription factor 1 [Platanthera guangdongensis]|uniref:GATA transcription factor 1 n=1 Tax=Platanthera guangdongensis TaxID=2320717 RepID=A0ABR2N373_9ASPA
MTTGPLPGLETATRCGIANFRCGGGVEGVIGVPPIEPEAEWDGLSNKNAFPRIEPAAVLNEIMMFGPYYVTPEFIIAHNSDDDNVVKEKRKCKQCGTEETSQWRAGPDGMKSLCNACGLRYRKSDKRARDNRQSRSATSSADAQSNSNRKAKETRHQTYDGDSGSKSRSVPKKRK